MEQKFLMYVLYITLVELREYAYEINDKKVFWFCDMLHNTPYDLGSVDDAKVGYEHLLSKVKHLGIEKWLETRKQEFYNIFPEYNI